jgi:nucleoside phosphorylase
MRSGILILSAHVPELSGLGAILGGDVSPGAAFGPPASFSGTAGGHALHARPVGIGLAASARGAALALRSFEPRAAVFVGTCGAYVDRGVAVGEVVVARRIRLVSTAVAEARGAFPAPMRTEIEGSGPLSQALVANGCRLVDVATTLAVTTDDALAARTAEVSTCEVEHLEAFAVAEACVEAQVPFAVVLGVANMVGSSARDGWRQNHRSAGHAAGSLVARWLEVGAPGLGPD